MKERRKKVNKVRTYDSDGYTQRAGCLCFKTDQELQVLLVTSNRFPDQWIVPSGGVELGESFQDAAIREVMEEAGVCGSIQRSLGMFQNDTNMSRTTLFTLIVKQEFEVWDDAANGRKRGWFPINKALTLLCHRPYQQLYLLTAMNTRKASVFESCQQNCEQLSMNTQWGNTVAVCVDLNG